MGKSANFLGMQNAIINYVNAHIPKDPNKAHFGIANGNRVIVGNKSFNYIPTVDNYFGDGSRVAVILPDNSNLAAVVGVP